MGSSDTIFGILPKLQSNNITVDQNRCILVRNKNAHCMKCAQACTSGCISVKDSLLYIQEDLCVGCGTCATVCPTCALEAHNPTDQELFEACIHACEGAIGHLSICCEQVAKPTDTYQLGVNNAPDTALQTTKPTVWVTCLGRVDESLLVLLARAGFNDVELVHAACNNCKLSCGLQTAKMVCDTTNTLLEAWGHPRMVHLKQISDSHKNMTQLVSAHQKEAATEDKLRNYVASHAKANSAPTDGTVQREPSSNESECIPHCNQPAKVQNDGTLAHYLPKRRNRLLKGLNSLGAAQDCNVETRLWGHVVIDTNTCVSCQMCAVFCPTEAIHKYEESDGSFGIEHYPSRCVKCGCCTDICPSQALSLQNNVRTTDLSPKAHVRYPMRPRDVALGAHQMKQSIESLLPGSHIFER